MAQLEGDWKTSTEAVGRAETAFRESCKGAAWEIDTAWFFGLGSNYYQGNLREIAARCEALATDAELRGDCYASAIIGAILSHFALLASDEPAEAVRRVREAMTLWSRSGFHIQHMWQFWSMIDVDLYAGDGSQAWRRVVETWPALRRSPAMYVQFTRVCVLDLRGRAALAAAAAARSAGERGTLLDDVARTARKLERERADYADLFASFLCAGVDALAGRHDSAVRRLVIVEDASERLGMPLHRIVAQRRRGELLADEAGRRLCEASERWLAGEGVRRPERYANLIAPWTKDSGQLDDR